MVPPKSQTATEEKNRQMSTSGEQRSIAPKGFVSQPRLDDYSVLSTSEGQTLPIAGDEVDAKMRIEQLRVFSAERDIAEQDKFRAQA